MKLRNKFINASAVVLSLFFICCDEISPEYKMSIYSTNTGVINTVKKAYQLTDLTFTPVNNLTYNIGTYYKNTHYKGMIYSSVKEFDLYVGNDVSVYTFMTAIQNPRSKLYTDEVNKYPYHGINCCSYYGTTCSAFVSYSLGLPNILFSCDFPFSKLMKRLESFNVDSLHVGDVLWRKGHVALITGLSKDELGHVNALEISEAIQQGCVRNIVTSKRFLEMMGTDYSSVYRYLEIDRNLEFKSISEFVPVLGEKINSFSYNNFLCVDKGDKSCYLEREEVVVNIFQDVDRLEIYKNNELYQVIDVRGNIDISLGQLPYGDYKARVSWDNNVSDFTCWKVVNVETKYDRKSGVLYFKSLNAIPFKLRGANLAGDRSSIILNRIISKNEREQGYIVIPKDSITESFPYLHVSFKTDYGKIIDIPQN